MRRKLIVVAMSAVLGMTLWAPGAHTEPPTKDARVPPGLQPAATRNEHATPAVESPMDSAKVFRVLSKPITIDFPANATIADALQVLQDNHQVQIVVEALLFNSDPDLKEKFPEGIEKQQLHLPKLKDVPLGRILRMVVEPVSGTFVVRQGTIFVVPQTYVASGQVLHQPVTGVFTRVPLERALATLADQTGATVVLDELPGDAGDASATPVTATFNDAPLDTAVRLLVNMTNLQVVRLDSVLYVTSSTKAQALLGELKDRRKRPVKRSSGHGVRQKL